jgi:hypothetical protein
MENPITSIGELVVGLLTGALGYTASDVIDRLIVTRERKDDKGAVMAIRFPEAPLMDDFLPRAGAAVAIAAAPLIVAQYISSPMGRSALQFFGFGAAFRFLGKAVDDVAAYLFKDSAADSTGKKLFAGEIGQRAAVGLTGLGAAPCPNCGSAAGLGACGCRSMLPQFATNLPIQPSPVLPSIPPGGGQPPVVNQGPYVPPGFVPPGGGGRVPGQPATPPPPGIMVPPVGTNIQQQPPGYAPPSPIAAMPLPAAQAGVNGLGDVSAAREVLRSHGPAYTALRKNRDILSAAANGHATASQKAYADRIVAQHRGSFAALQQFHPAVLDTAARGLGLVVDEGPSTWPGASRHRSDEAAE